MATSNCLVTNTLQNIFFCEQQKNLIQLLSLEELKGV